MTELTQTVSSTRVRRLAACLAVLLTLWLTAYPLVRAFFRVEIDYNEGWNTYNTQRLVENKLLYPVALGWRSNNYPIGWFALLAALHHLTHEYLFTARAVAMLALFAVCLLVAVVVRHFGVSRLSSLLAALFCLDVFATSADPYFAMDDPQMLAQAIFLLGFFVYLRGRTSPVHVTGCALLCVIAGSIKHNPLDVPLAVLLDLLFLSWPLALLFSVAGLALAGISILLNLHFGGPFFLAQMLLPRTWSFAHLWQDQIEGVLGPILIPLLLALGLALRSLAWRSLAHSRLRPAALLLVCALIVGTVFGGGSGVSLNTYFSVFVAMSIALGLLFDPMLSGGGLPRWTQCSLAGLPLRGLALPLLFLWLLIPAAVNDDLNPVNAIRQTREDARSFTREVDFLRAQPQPALCESLLRCWVAKEPYLYDPFNATRLIRFHKLDPTPLVEALQQGRIGAVEMDQILDQRTEQERWPAALLLAIRQNYHPALVDDDVAIYLPNRPAPHPGVVLP